MEKKQIAKEISMEKKRCKGLRGEVLRMKRLQGERYSLWSSETWKQGKKVRRPDMGIRVLKDKKGILKYEEETEEVIREYIGDMWGSKEQLPNQELEEKVWGREEAVDIDKTLNGEITEAELDRAINKLKERI